MGETMRISRALALAGIDSRRKCETYVQSGYVKVNGETVYDLGRQVDPETDVVFFRGEPVVFDERVYFVLNKPKGYVTTAADPHAKRTVYDLLPRALTHKASQPGSNRTRVFPVGRLDKDSTGLLLFTNDGDLANALTHPRYGAEKWYVAKLNRAFDPRDGKRLLGGVHLPEGFVKIQEFHKISQRVLRVMIREGKKREVRRIFSATGYKVISLCRVSFGPLKLGDLELGMGRFLKGPEVRDLKQFLTKKESRDD